jgi:hypothetical protein
MSKRRRDTGSCNSPSPSKKPKLTDYINKAMGVVNATTAKQVHETKSTRLLHLEKEYESQKSEFLKDGLQ